MMSGLTIVTAVDQKFFRTTCQFLLSCLRHQLHQKHAIILYDLGMTAYQREFLNQRFIRPHQLDLQTFQFKDFPPFLQIHPLSESLADYKQNVRNNSGAYAWKPAIIYEVLEKTRGMVLWLDSGTIILKPLDEIESSIRQNGLFTPLAGTGKICERTHPDTLNCFKDQHLDFSKRFRSGGVCGFNGQFPRIRELVSEWRRLSLIETCIAPADADDHNHRFDQSILSLLLYRFERYYHITLTADEIDISSTHPVSCLTTRHKVPNSVPLWCDPFVWRSFTVYRFLEIFILKLKKKMGIKI